MFASGRYDGWEATKAGLVLILPVFLCVHFSLPAFSDGLRLQKVFIKIGLVLSLSLNALRRMISKWTLNHAKPETSLIWLGSRHHYCGWGAPFGQNKLFAPSEIWSLTHFYRSHIHPLGRWGPVIGQDPHRAVWHKGANIRSNWLSQRDELQKEQPLKKRQRNTSRLR